MAFDRITALLGTSLAALLVAAPAWASIPDLTISSGATSGVTCTAGVCRGSSRAANLNVTDLTNMLGASDVTLQGDSTFQDILVRVPVAWASTHKLTLAAYRSIMINATITVQGTSGLTLTTGGGGTLSIPKNIAFWDLTSSLTINGNSYTLAGDIATLASDIAAAPSGRYALANNYDATPDGTYASVAIPTAFTGTFEGLGNTISHFTLADATTSTGTGLFSTLQGGAIRDLKMTAATITTSKEHDGGVGILLGYSDGGAIANVRVQGRMTCRGAGYTAIGGVVGTSIHGGSIDNAYANAIVKIGTARPAEAGILVGDNGDNIAAITNSQSAGKISQIGDSRAVTMGGLVGYNWGTISFSQSSASVTRGGDIGGLVGVNVGTISNSAASGNVAGPADNAGGLAGFNSVIYLSVGNITGSHASGNVTNTAGTAGGLAGQNVGSAISSSYATGNVSGDLSAGGIAGNSGTFNGTGGTIDTSFATGTVTASYAGVAGGVAGGVGAESLGQPGGSISRSFATGNVTGGDNSMVGGVVGTITVGSVQDVYAMGAVSGGANSKVGGLAGRNGFDASNMGTIATSYSTGAVSGGAGSFLGGLLGYQTAGAGSVSSSYWDTDTSGITNTAQGAGNVSSEPGITAQTSAQLQSGVPAGFSTSIWSQGGGMNTNFPYLVANPPH
ncbi:MAG TPA: hypothetical protein VFV07_12500 [Rhizomicrobium sp.]|nr:hypothetical protein [Rhizomicrobium sp.]